MLQVLPITIGTNLDLAKLVFVFLFTCKGAPSARSGQGMARGHAQA